MPNWATRRLSLPEVLACTVAPLVCAAAVVEDELAAFAVDVFTVLEAAGALDLTELATLVSTPDLAAALEAATAGADEGEAAEAATRGTRVALEAADVEPDTAAVEKGATAVEEGTTAAATAAEDETAGQVRLNSGAWSTDPTPTRPKLGLGRVGTASCRMYQNVLTLPNKKLQPTSSQYV